MTALLARRALLRVSVAAVLANSTWFSATAVVPSLTREWHLSAAGAAALAIAVQAGFITGSVGSALLNLADRVEPRRLMAAAAVSAAAFNAELLTAGGIVTALPSRFLVGVAIAGVYAPGVRLVATHFQRGRGLASGVVVGALTLGGSTPHLLRGLADIPWQWTIAATSVLAFCAVPAILPVRAGPAGAAVPPLDLGAAWRALGTRPLRLTTGSYLAHMWELYAFWAWLPMFFAASRPSAPGRVEAGVVAFAAIGLAGLGGCVAGGVLADRVGRTVTTSAAMLASAACCAASPLAFHAPTCVLVAVLLIWGFAVIADSAQFSAAVTELAEPQYAGSVLTLQLALGFALTVASIRLVPLVADATGWRYALLPLTAGPLLGAAGMLRLRGLPAARLLAGGRR